MMRISHLSVASYKHTVSSPSPLEARLPTWKRGTG